MAHEFHEAKQAVTGGFSPTALLCVFQSFAYRQGGAACSAYRRLRHVRIHPAQPYPAGPNVSSLTAGNSGGVLTRAPGHFFHAVKLALGLALHLPTHVLSQSFRGRRVVHLSKRLSCSPSLDGSTTIEKAFGDGRISFGGQQIVFPR